MSAIYRSYEVLIEETAENHKTRNGGKTTKELKPHHENTRRALKVTHDLFQDAVCFADGRLRTFCKMLDDAERKVESLVKDKDGRKRARPFELEEHAEAGQDNGDVED